MNTLTELDDPLGPPPIEPAVIRRRARQIQRRRSGRQLAGVAGGAAVLMLGVSLVRPETVRVETDKTVPAVQPPACEPGHIASRSILVMSGNSPADNEQIIAAIQAAVQTEDFAPVLRSHLDVELAARFPDASLMTAITVSRPPAAATLKISARATSAEDAEQLSAAVLTSLTEVFEHSQRNLPIEERLPGPIFQEIFTKPVMSRVGC